MNSEAFWPRKIGVGVASPHEPSVFVQGGLHGDEACGTFASLGVYERFQLGELKLLRGRADFVPIANRAAYFQNLRLLINNWNRIFWPTLEPVTYEQRILNYLCGLVENRTFFLDIHSMSMPGPSWLNCRHLTPAIWEVARILGPRFLVEGWTELHEQEVPSRPAKTTMHWAHECGTPSLILESGPHNAQKSVDVATNAILNCLRHFGMIEGSCQQNELRRVRLTQMYRRQKGERLVCVLENFAWVQEGEPLIEGSGGLLCAPYSSYLVMPTPSAPLDDDWLYLGVPLN